MIAWVYCQVTLPLSHGGSPQAWGDGAFYAVSIRSPQWLHEFIAKSHCHSVMGAAPLYGGMELSTLWALDHLNDCMSLLPSHIATQPWGSPQGWEDGAFYAVSIKSPQWLHEFIAKSHCHSAMGAAPWYGGMELSTLWALDHLNDCMSLLPSHIATQPWGQPPGMGGWSFLRCEH